MTHATPPLPDNPQTETNREKRKRLIQQQITRAAGDTFLEKGYQATTINEIAQRARITKRTLYKHFPSKIALYMEMFDHYLEQYYTKIAEAARLDLPTDQVLFRLFDAIYTFTKENEKFMRLFWMLDTDEYEGIIPQQLRDRVNKWSVANITEAVAVVKRAKEEGLIIDISPELLVHVVSSMNKGIFTHAHKERKFNIASVDPDILYENIVGILKRGLMTGAVRINDIDKKR